jgi:hypothetical protein
MATVVMMMIIGLLSGEVFEEPGEVSGKPLEV